MRLLPSRLAARLSSREVFYGALALWIGFVAITYFRAVPAVFNFFSFFSLRGLPRQGAAAFLPLYYLTQVALAGLLFASAFGWGRLVSAVFRFEYASKSEESVFSTGFGFALLSYCVLAAGWAGVLHRAVCLLLLVPGALNCLRLFLKERGSLVPLPSLRQGAFVTFLKLSMACSLLFVLVTALAPEIFVDGLYYLTLPAMWLRAHGIAPDHNTVLSFFPANGLYIYLLGLAYGDGVTAKLIHFGFGLLTVFSLHQWTRKRYGPEAAATTGFLYLTVPFVLIVMCRTGMDLMTSFFETLALFSILAFIEAPREGRGRWLAAGALFCGTALATKHLSAFCFIGLSAILLFTVLRRKARVRDLFVFVLLAVLLFAPYVVRNYLATGMPLYPFSASSSKDITWMSRGQQVTITEPRQMPRTPGNLLTAPWHIAVQDKSTDEPFSGALLLALLPLLLLLRRDGDDTVRRLAAYVAVYYVCWFMVRTYFRYLLPALPALCIVLGYLVSRVPGEMRRITTAALVLLGTANVLFAVDYLCVVVDPWPVVTGHLTRDEYLSTQRSRYYQNPAYPAIRWANRHLPENAKILFFGEARGFYCERDFVISGISDPNPLVALVKASTSGDELYRRVRERGYTHILWNVPEMVHQRRYDTLDVSLRDLAVFDEFWRRHARLLHRALPDVAEGENGVRSCRLQQPGRWERRAADPFNYVYLYEIVPAGEPTADFLLSPEMYCPERRELLFAEMRAGRTPKGS